MDERHKGRGRGGEKREREQIFFPCSTIFNLGVARGVVQTTTPRRPRVYFLRLFKRVKIYNAGSALFHRHVHTTSQPPCLDTVPLQSYFAEGRGRGYRPVPYVHTISLCTRIPAYPMHACEYIYVPARVYTAYLCEGRSTRTRERETEKYATVERERSGVASVLCGEERGA